MYHSAQPSDNYRKVLGYVLLAAGAVLLLTALPLWFWLGILGAACVAAGYALAGSRK